MDPRLTLQAASVAFLSCLTLDQLDKYLAYKRALLAVNPLDAANHGPVPTPSTPAPTARETVGA